MNKKLLTMGLAALLMAGCSSDDVVGGEGDKGGTVNGTAYVGLKLQLPSVNGSRAGESFEAATADENKVNTLDVVFLDDANKVVQHEPIAIGDLHWTDDPAAGIGTVAELPVIKMNKSDVQKVLILVNNQGNVTIPAVGTTAIDVTSAKGVSNLTTSGFFMTNALLTDGTTSSYLVSVTPKKTEAEAQAEASNNVIYVERAAAKVTVTTNLTNTYTVPSTAAEDYRDSEVKFSGWLLDVTNTQFYPVHQMDNKYFSADYISSASGTVFGDHRGNRFYETVATPKRVYWATAPYYDVAAVISGTPTFTVATDETPEASFKGFGNLAPQYCAENTFTVQQMMQTHTTRTLLKATYKPAKVMLKKNTDVDWSLQTPPASDADVIDTDITDGMNWYRLGNSSNAWVDKSLKARLLKYFQDEAGMTEATEVIIENVKAGTHDFSEVIGGVTYNKVTVVTSGGGAPTVIDGTALTNLRQAFGKLTAFVGGVCYYQVRIKHFGATPGYTPWGNEANAPTLTGLADAYTNYLTYGTDDAKKKVLDQEYLGRYGVVRNNYYDININSVSGPGEPTINDITPTTDPDDQQNYYIQATVKILDWAKRSQSVDL